MKNMVFRSMRHININSVAKWLRSITGPRPLPPSLCCRYCFGHLKLTLIVEQNRALASTKLSEYPPPRLPL